MLVRGIMTYVSFSAFVQANLFHNNQTIKELTENTEHPLTYK